MKLEKGKKYTRFGVGEQMPMCFRSEFTVKEVYDDGRPVIVNKGKRKRYLFNGSATNDTSLFIEGWELKPMIQPELVIGGCSTWSMDGNIVFVNTTLDEVKTLVKRNLNENFTRFDRVTISTEKGNVPITDLDMELLGECARAKLRKKA